MNPVAGGKGFKPARLTRLVPTVTPSAGGLAILQGAAGIFF